MSRQLLVTLVILACGLVPDRLAGDGPSRLRDSLKSNLFNRADLERIERGYYEQLLDAEPALDDLADVPGLRIRRRSGQHLVGPRRRRPAGHARRRPARGGLEAGRRHRAMGRALAHQRAGHARPGLRDRQAARDVPDRARGRLDRRRLGSRTSSSGSNRSWNRPGTPVRERRAG